MEEKTIEKIFAKVKNGKPLDKEEAVSLLKIRNNSSDFFKLILLANEMTRSEFNNKGFIFAQIGLNAAPCPVDCKFCSMGKSHYAMDSIWEKDVDSVLSEAKSLINDGIHDLFLMTTADYSIDLFLKIASQIKAILPNKIRLVANIGDFDYDVALKLKEVGFTGVYHINRLREGIDTTISPKIRIKTLDSIKKAGLELYYCIEPIGPEHNYEEIADEMLRARDYNVGVMAVMRRIPVEGSPLYENGQISSVELSKIAAVTRIVTRPHRAMNAHEPIQMSLICGVNQLYAEVGANPRDNISNTEKSRGLTVATIRQLLIDAEYEI
ncbi:MAG TPA: radical SAM protein [Firmicutes bacterium]|nr:radical SAM protein [Bacillota bacterium]HBK68165.1 radical SAM protein [Bacillota bacterium]HBT18297.1 radical SAM protein [Bacillota bacterium]